MKVLHILPGLNQGGAQRLVVSLLPKLKKDISVSLLVFIDIDGPLKETLLENGIKVESLNSKPKNPLTVFKLIKAMRGYDIVHVHLVYPLYWVSFASIFRRIKLVYTEHSTFNRRRYYSFLQPIERFVYGRYKKVISISKQTQDALLEWLKEADLSRFCIVNNGIDLSQYDALEGEQKRNRLIMVSRFVPSKDQITAINALLYLDSSYILYFVGDGETRSICEELVRELNLQNRVVFLGARFDVPQLLHDSFIGIQSSNWEGFGLSAVEIMASGIPLVASSVDGLKQIVDGAGLLFQKGDAKELSELIMHLSSDEEFYQRVSKKCKERASKYSIDSTASGYLKVYQEVCGLR